MEYLKRLQYNSPVILTYMIICLGALCLGYLTKDYTTNLIFSVYRSSLSDPLSYIRIFSHVLGHSNFEHFFNNFLLILIVGPMLEEKYGSKIIFILIVITAFVTGVFQIIISPNGLLGASGVAFMLIVLTSFVNMQTGRIPLTIVAVVFMYLGKEIYSGVVYQDNISQLTHIVGGVCGIFFGIILNKIFKETKGKFRRC